MGLLGKLLGKDKGNAAPKVAAPAANPLEYVNLWNIAEPTRAIIMDGDRSVKLYVYDPQAFASVPVGQRLELETVRGDVGMRSAYTGETWHTKKEKDVAVAYEGRIVGIASLDGAKVKEAAKKGYSVYVAARCDGYMPDYGNAKDINLYIPNGFDIEVPIERDKARQIGARGTIDIKGITLMDETHFQHIATKNYWECPHVRIEPIQEDGKQKAKPNLGVYTEKGKLLMEVGSRRKLHGELMELKENYSEFFFFAYRRKAHDGRAYYEIDILCWN